ncbi:hypothetical protein GCK72_000054 [Caenorhabditis remanei]|uniref:F-box domain-containing protein n=1 Tax=Caenorhabditis remanei TaxID=31234 RepID=A0A6A5HR13_CAERE|nr:hypothetical protein GCK72_000054 [Caenorhabditis remanei]KAF1768242.1 hypothetical protein GCK72_000054 [Caenorhabditis remanei]
MCSAMAIPIRRLPYPVLRSVFKQMDPESLVNFIRTNKSSTKLLPGMSASVSVYYNSKDPYIVVTTASGIQSELPIGDYRKLTKVFKWIELDCLKIVVSDRFKCLRLLSLLKHCKFTSCNYLIIEPVEEGFVLRKQALKDIMKQLRTINQMIIEVSMEELPENIDTSLAVTVTNGDLLEDHEIMFIDAEEILVDSSRIGDTGANLIIKNWMAHGENLRYLELRLADEWKMFEDDHLGMEWLLFDLEFQIRGEGRFETKHLGNVLNFEEGFDIERDDGKKATIVRTPDTLYFMVWD